MNSAFPRAAYDQWFLARLLMTILASVGAAAGSSADREAEALVAAEMARLEQLMVQARTTADGAKTSARGRGLQPTIIALETVLRQLPENALTQDTRLVLQGELRPLQLRLARDAVRAGDVATARQALAAYEQGGTDRASGRVARALSQLSGEQATPQPGPDAAPAALPDRSVEVEQARQAFAAGQIDLAETTLRAVAAEDPSHPVVQRYLAQIADFRRSQAEVLRERARSELLHEVQQGWQRATASHARPNQADEAERGPSPLLGKLEKIRIPQVGFQGVELSRVATVLSELSTQYDGEEANRGVNIVVIDPAGQNPKIALTLRHLSLKRILDFVTDAVGFRYEVQHDAIVIRPGGEVSALDTEVFAVTRSTVIRMTGMAAASSTPAAVDPFAPAPAAPAAGAGGVEAQALRNFLQQAGVNFEGTPGSSLAYDGSAMIVTHSARNLERIRNILNRYNDVRQVEIEAKFMEVQQGALEELGVNWSLTHGRNGDPQYQTTVRAQGRSLAQGFTHTVSGQSGRIVNPGRETEIIRNPDGTIFQVVPGQNAINQPIINQAASLPGGADLAAQAEPLALITGRLGEIDVEATIRALSRHAGTDLLSAPKVTVLSGHPATITVAQEMRFPQSFGEIQSQVGSARSESSSAGVTITAGTPQDFATRNIGVELRVTPTVEEDDYSISLDLNPKVTEFEGFVEYGGQSVAISGGTTVTVPSGFFQPVFSTREVSTRVTLWDGATLVMGGLTREEVKRVEDKVPILGDLPLIGRAFRSKGESSQKRNLLIFVTANLVSPGGSPKKQLVRGVPPSSLFQSPTLVGPGGARARERETP